MASDDFYLKRGLGGHFGGRTLIQAYGKIGGNRSVFVNLVGSGKNALVYPTFGGVVINPPKGRAKIFAGDLMEYDPGITDPTTGPSVKILKVFEVAKDVAADGKSVLIVRNGYRHIPFIGDNIMIAPSTLDGTGAGVTVIGVNATTDSGADVWELTLSAALGAVAKKGSVLVEAAKVGEDSKAMVTNPNAYADKDNDFFYDPNITRSEDGDGAQYSFTPALANEDTILRLDKINTLPPAILALNKSKVNGWFNL